MSDFRLAEFIIQWAGKDVIVSRPATEHEREYYGGNEFGGVFESCYFFEEDGAIWVCGADGFAQRLTIDTIIKEVDDTQ